MARSIVMRSFPPRWNRANFSEERGYFESTRRTTNELWAILQPGSFLGRRGVMATEKDIESPESDENLSEQMNDAQLERPQMRVKRARVRSANRIRRVEKELKEISTWRGLLNRVLRDMQVRKRITQESEKSQEA